MDETPDAVKYARFTRGPGFLAFLNGGEIIGPRGTVLVVRKGSFRFQ